jgi:hypothetical protein
MKTKLFYLVLYKYIVMSQHSIITLETNSVEQINLFKAMAKALKVKFEIKEKGYNPEFVEKIIESKKQISEGKYIDVKGENLQSFIDSL